MQPGVCGDITVHLYRMLMLSLATGHSLQVRNIVKATRHFRIRIDFSNNSNEAEKIEL